MASMAEQMFNDADSSADGQLSLVELSGKLNDWGLEDKLIERLFLKLDTNNDKMLSKQEFEHFNSALAALDNDEEDGMDHDAEADLGGYAPSASSMSDKQRQEMRTKFDQHDRDKDGKIGQLFVPVPCLSAHTVA